MSLMPIPWDSIFQYANVYELDEEEREDLAFFIRRMDKTYLDYHERKRKAEQGKK